MQRLEKRVTELEHKLQPEGPVTFRLVMHGEHVDDGTRVIRLTWGDEPDQVQPEGGEDARD